MKCNKYSYIKSLSICDLSHGKRPKAATQGFTGRAFERKAINEERCFPGTLQLNNGRSKLVTIC